MTHRRVFAAAALVAALALAWPGRLAAQAIQRSMYVSVLDEAGAPVPDLGPSDFIVREDNATREVLRKHGGLWFYDESYVISRRRD